MGNDEREACIPTVFFRVIMKRPQKSQKVTIQFSILDENEFTLHGSRHILMLVEALKASSDRIEPKLTIMEIYIAEASDKEAVESVFQLIDLQCYPVDLKNANAKPGTSWKSICLTTWGQTVGAHCPKWSVEESWTRLTEYGARLIRR